MAIALSFSGCGPGEETDYRDFLTARGTVYSSNGVTPAADVEVAAYDWVTTFTDGSTVANRFDFAAASLTTGASGEFTFDSARLALTSGNATEYCTEVCVEESIAWEEVCTRWDYDYYDECVAWDEDGNCTDWQTYSDPYCAQWTLEPYTYCSAYGLDCAYYYPSRSVDDVKSAYSTITYRAGTELRSTESTGTNTPATSIVKTSTAVAGGKVVETRWNQTDAYITELVSAASRSRAATGPLALRRPTPGKNHKPADYVAPRLGRTHAPSPRLPCDKLSPAQQTRLETARKLSGADPR